MHITPGRQGTCVMGRSLKGKDGSVLGGEMEEALLNDLYGVGSS